MSAKVHAFRLVMNRIYLYPKWIDALSTGSSAKEKIRAVRPMDPFRSSGEERRVMSFGLALGTTN